MSSEGLDMQIKRDGNGIPLPMFEQPPELMNIQGFTFEIKGVFTIPSLLQLSGLDKKVPTNKVKGADSPELIGRPTDPAEPAEAYAQVSFLN